MTSKNIVNISITKAFAVEFLNFIYLVHEALRNHVGVADFFMRQRKRGEKNLDQESEFSVEFLVIDAFTEEPIPAAQINITQYNLQTYTDFEGIARIEHLKRGTYDLEISFVSYKKKHLPAYQLDRSNSKITVKLQP